jgi:hypothetical protein
MDDFTQRFVIGHGAVRGEYVRIGPAWRAMLERRAYPPAVTALLGECLAASALFTSTLKMLQDDGRLSIQIQQGKPVSMLVAECRADLSVRAMARVDPGETPADGAALTERGRGNEMRAKAAAPFPNGVGRAVPLDQHWVGAPCRSFKNASRPTEVRERQAHGRSDTTSCAERRRQRHHRPTFRPRATGTTSAFTTRL